MHVRGTQSFVHMVGACAKRPGLLAIELLWRWGFGIPALAILGYEGMRLLANPALSRENLSDFSFTDPLGGCADQVAAIVHRLLPRVLGFIRWLFPALAIGWAVASGLGRSVLLKRLDPGMRFAPFTLIALQLLRILALAAADDRLVCRRPLGGRLHSGRRRAQPGRLFRLGHLPLARRFRAVGAGQLDCLRRAPGRTWSKARA